MTLLEIMMVVALLGLIAASIAPKLKGVMRVSVQSSTRRFAALVRFSYDQAVLTGRVHRIVLNLDEQAWSVEATQPGALPLDKARVGLMAESLREENRNSQEAEFKAIPSTTVGNIPRGVQITEFASWRTGGLDKPLTKGTVSIYVFPNGLMDEAAVTLAEDGKDTFQSFKILTQPLTGRVKVETITKP